MAVSVEDVSSSLVREYLSRKGLKRTIACMDEEHPRTETQNCPMKTLLEIIVKYHTEDFKGDKINDSDCNYAHEPFNSTATSPALRSTLVSDTKTKNSTMAYVNYTHSILSSEKEETCTLQPTAFYTETDKLSSQNQPGYYEGHTGQAQISFIRDNEKKTENKESTQRSKTNQVRRGMMAGPIANTPQEPNKKRHSRRLEEPLKLLRKEETTQSWDGPLATGFHHKSLKSSLNEIGSDRVRQGTWSGPERMQAENFEKVGPSTAKVKTCLHVAEVNMSEMVLDDIDDDDDQQDLHSASFQRTIADYRCAGQPMDQHTAAELKTLLLGSSLTCFNVEWRSQGFTFSETHDLRYGIVQKKGGPCGVLASVQAFVLKRLLFENSESSNTGLQRLSPSNTTRRKCLALAAAEILWRAGEEKRATVAINSGRNHFIPAGHHKSEGLLEKITCFTVDSIKDLQLLLEQHVEQFETEAFGCLLLTISAVLSRSIKRVREDMDVPTTSLIGAHGYCTQELVNLLLCGRAVSNVFDNDMELDSGNGNMTLLKGIKSHCDIGLLSLFEHYNICKVGDYLKTPRFPIWVVCSESHFSVLFGLQRELLTSQEEDLEFDLYYYDGLANQQEEIRLTVSVGKSTINCENGESDLIPPLELCIRTRWKDALVNWNDTEPIL
ncbi:probable ubiquitin carboxyl-terminal hydrolase MINDY-4 isoform X2 [Betta splendens]|uniref:Ubiquitin carboxyl-terminal hydrolase MINDY n=1 Tax=Betta splendens TaxID=158456 RepID=A0A9W2XRR7_BETSP|nr:probable ubiquitin carboxyl-terminal hydrolase MINDY-4 isoform X2 [Betta splendens]